jgi:hypothetical protein
LPALVANGVKDVMIPAEHSFAIARTAPNAKLVLYPDAGHAFLFQYVEEFTREVFGILMTLAGPAVIGQATRLAGQSAKVAESRNQPNGLRLRVGL